MSNCTLQESLNPVLPKMIQQKIKILDMLVLSFFYHLKNYINFNLSKLWIKMNDQLQVILCLNNKQCSDHAFDDN